MRSLSPMVLLLAMVITLAACVVDQIVDPSTVPGVNAGCEAPTEAQEVTTATMLPGRNCGACHLTGKLGATTLLTLAGTVYSSVNSPCNSGGLAGVVVEISDSSGNVQPGGMLVTDSVGNFYSTIKYQTPFYVRLYDQNNPSRFAESAIPLGSASNAGGLVDCSGCHQIPALNNAPGRLFLSPP